VKNFRVEQGKMDGNKTTIVLLKGSVGKKRPRPRGNWGGRRLGREAGEGTVQSNNLKERGEPGNHLQRERLRGRLEGINQKRRKKDRQKKNFPLSGIRGNEEN